MAIHPRRKGWAMQPHSRVRRKNGRNTAQRHSEHQLTDPRKMTPRELIEEAEEILARQAWITRPEAQMLGVLLIGVNGVEVITLADDNVLDYPDAIPGKAEVVSEESLPAPSGVILQDARGWLLDCFGHEEGATDAIHDMSAIEIQSYVNRFYHGGWDGFMLDGMYR